MIRKALVGFSSQLQHEWSLYGCGSGKMAVYGGILWGFLIPAILKDVPSDVVAQNGFERKQWWKVWNSVLNVVKSSHSVYFLVGLISVRHLFEVGPFLFCWVAFIVAS